MNEQQLVILRQGQDGHVVQLQCLELSERDVVASIEGQLKEYIEQHRPTKLSLDFTPVRFITSEMLSTLLRLRDSAVSHGSTLQISGLSSSVRDVFRVTKLERLFGIDDEFDGAVAVAAS